MSAEACDLECSLAEEQDLQQVLNICGPGDYNGLDYMAAFYHRWLQEPGRLVFIAKVALESVLRVDGGQTVLVQGLRVVSDLRGHGIAGALQRHVTAYVRRHFPEVSAVRLSRGDPPPPQMLSKYRLIAKEAIFSLCCEAADLGLFVAELQSRLPCQADSSSSSGPVRLNQQQAASLILSPHVVSNLLPGKTIICDWEPLRPVEANLEVLWRRGLTWIADREYDPAAISLLTPPYSVPLRHDALRININIFGHSLPSVCSVLLAQLEALLPSVHGYLVIYAYVDPAVWPGLRQFCQTEANVTPFKDYWENFILEADL
ncbi:probable N-acetyltransferase 16 isoform X2 [Parambassis ranga]|uniref:Probable N-acetyltransferase 16 isoform X2 n=1 Tax=Parambassis ranga TaxID=210632 RepID=A0A6P7JVF2_9TELE|nr:probable N-acetyltransferase 16 isoform X2 [Parambassis ranga]